MDVEAWLDDCCHAYTRVSPGRSVRAHTIATATLSVDYRFIAGARLSGHRYHDCASQTLVEISSVTVALKNQGFRPRVKVGDRVLTGAPLIEFHLDFIATHAKSFLTQIIITNPERTQPGSVRPVTSRPDEIPY